MNSKHVLRTLSRLVTRSLLGSLHLKSNLQSRLEKYAEVAIETGNPIGQILAKIRSI